MFSRRRADQPLCESLEPRIALSTYFIATAGNDNLGDGSQANPFATIQRAADLIKPGDIVDVTPGNYAGFVMGWDSPQAGTSDAPITFQAEPGATITSRNNKTADGIDLEIGDHFINIYGFTITNDTS